MKLVEAATSIISVLAATVASLVVSMLALGLLLSPAKETPELALAATVIGGAQLRTSYFVVQAYREKSSVSSRDCSALWPLLSTMKRSLVRRQQIAAPRKQRRQKKQAD